VSNGQTVGSPVTIAGLCTSDYLLKVFSNGVFVGSTTCKNGSYSLQIGLFPGVNQIIVRIYDNANQVGPDSNPITLNYSSAQYTAFASLITLTSVYARKGADPGKTLTWPVILSGGFAPYAVSVDWGDGQPASLISQKTSGPFDITHVYSNAGVYKVVIKVTDASGNTAFLQLVGVGNGQATSATNSTPSSGTSNTAVINNPAQTRALLITYGLMFILIPIAFWLGRRYELLALHRQLDREAEEFARREAEMSAAG
jgi:hypothetical protein